MRGASFPLGRPPAPGAGVQGRTRLHPAVAAPLPPWPTPRAFPRPGLNRAHPGLRDRLAPRPETPSRSLRRSTPAASQAAVAAVAILTILSLGSAQSPQPPPPSSSDSSQARPLRSQPMKTEVHRRPRYGGPPRLFPAETRSYFRGWRGSGREGGELEASEGAGNIRELGASSGGALATQLVRARSYAEVRDERQPGERWSGLSSLPTEKEGKREGSGARSAIILFLTLCFYA